ncbi:GIY-YIG nuclease family protein [Pseudomonas aeruginosa]|nr:GIY-YIG nuclease family protein [Pseudomonas aeruginosa]
MAEFFYQIKRQRRADEPEGMFGSPWHWPPEFSGIVEAETKKEAKAMVDEIYGLTFPQRVLEKDLPQQPYLLHLQLVPDDPNDYLRKRLSPQECEECGSTFDMITKFNSPFCTYKGERWCSDKCHTEGRDRERLEFRVAGNGLVPPVIYQVRQVSTGKLYVGQTKQPFTFRWWQHITAPTGSKFHDAIRAAPKTDWEFRVLEIIKPPEGRRDVQAYMNERERFWIDELQAVTHGFNTVLPTGDCAQDEMLLETG